MNKKKFLKLLEEKLNILSEEERKDIINEYKDTIEEKVRHGSSEEEAVADFGSLEELSREILKAYKINPDYSKKEENDFKEIVNEGENLIKKSAEKLSKWTKDTVEDFKNNDHNWTLETIFEIIIKAVIMLIGLALLRIPFYFIEYLGTGIFEMAFSPVDAILRIIWRCVISLIYFLACIVIAMIVFRPYFSSEQKNIKKKINQQNSSNQETQKTLPSKNNNVILEIVKALVFIFTVFPLYFVDLGCYIAVAACIFLLVQGVPIIGPLLISISISIFFTFLTHLIYQLLYGKKKIYCYSLIISAILFVSGCFFTISAISRFETYSDLPNEIFKSEQMTLEETITGNYFSLPYWYYTKQEDNELEDGKIEIIIDYYPDFIKDIQSYTTNENEKQYLHIKKNYKNPNKKVKKQLYHLIVDELKEYRFYEYSVLSDLKITVRANHNTIDKIK